MLLPFSSLAISAEQGAGPGLPPLPPPGAAAQPGLRAPEGAGSAGAGAFETAAPENGFPSRNSRGKESAHLLRLFSNDSVGLCLWSCQYPDG